MIFAVLWVLVLLLCRGQGCVTHVIWWYIFIFMLLNSDALGLNGLIIYLMSGRHFRKSMMFYNVNLQVQVHCAPYTIRVRVKLGLLYIICSFFLDRFRKMLQAETIFRHFRGGSSVVRAAAGRRHLAWHLEAARPEGQSFASSISKPIRQFWIWVTE